MSTEASKKPKSSNLVIIICIAVAICLAGVIFYFGYLRNEEVCYKAIDEEITDGKNYYSTDNSVTGLNIRLRLAEASIKARSIKYDEHRNICDYYLYAASLKRK